MTTIEVIEESLTTLEKENQLLTVDEIDTIHFETFFRPCEKCDPENAEDGCSQCFAGATYYFDWPEYNAGEVDPHAEFTDKLLKEGCILINFGIDPGDTFEFLQHIREKIEAASKVPFLKIEKLPDHIIDFVDVPHYALIFPKSYVSVLMAVLK